MKNIPIISIVIPLYNESEIFHELIKRLNKVIESFDKPIEVVLIDDGSNDETPLMMKQIALLDEKYQCVFLSRNFGHQLAITAGLSVARASDAIMMIDGDLQDPPELLKLLYGKLSEGYDIVYAIRKKRKEGWLKKTLYFAFYRILKKLSSMEMPLDSGDFSIIRRNVVDIINKMPEESRYLRGMRTWVGFKQIGLEYNRDERFAGKTKYSFRNLMKLASNGIFNFSETPIKFITILGIITTAISSLYAGYTLYMKLIHQNMPSGFTAIVVLISFIGGVQLISLGIIGEYVLRIFFQVKGRPLFIIKNRIVNKNFIDAG
jgi:dolichol-phosphate mannosyltransferase